MNARTHKHINIAFPILLYLKCSVFTIVFLGSVANGGNFGDAFLQIGTTPKTMALGQASVAVPRYWGGFLTNPAAIGNVPYRSLHFMATDQFSLANYYTLGVTLPLMGDWFGAMNFLSLQVNDIPIRPDLRTIFSIEERRNMIRDLSARSYKKFDDNETAIVFSFARSPDIVVNPGWLFEPIPVNLPLGVNIRAMRKHFYNLEGYGLGVDAGAMLRVDLPAIINYDWLGELTLGAAYRDIFGTIIYWNTKHKDKIEPDLVRGISYSQNLGLFSSKILFAFQFSSRFAGKTRKGFEISIMDRVATRMGSDLGRLQGGIGVNFPVRGRLLSVDYSYMNHELGDSHRIGVAVEF